MNQKGFTLIELVMVIVILAILGAVAIPKYVNLQTEAKAANEAGVVAGVRAGILTFFIDQARGNRTSYPAVLDTAEAGRGCFTTNPCFTTVLAQGGITDPQWTKLLEGQPPGTSKYQSSVSLTNVWTYTVATGEFVKTQN